MKSLIVILLFTFSLEADMGDCFSCHPELTDERHSAMGSCIECHSPSKSGVLECGEKCFSCHSKEDLEGEKIKEHLVFEECRECHVDAVHNLFDTSKSFDQSQRESLKDLLLN